MSKNDPVSTRDYTAAYVAKHFLEWRERKMRADDLRERIRAEKAAKADACANGDIEYVESSEIDWGLDD
tara:strand:+ start:469 stop:675 length:207 start_codon:yes stop_codon:yes gene_type:complete